MILSNPTLHIISYLWELKKEFIMITIYHNPRCKKSRAGLQFIADKTTDFEIKEYLKEDAFTVESLTQVLNQLGKSPMEMIRKQEEVFKKEITKIFLIRN